MNIIKDSLQLNYSDKFSVAGIEEADINIQLDNSTSTSSTVTGTVTCGGVPVPNATVKMFDKNDKPFAHDMTDERGVYTINNVPAGTYNTVASIDGYFLNDAINYVVLEGEIKVVNIAIEKNTFYNLNSIAGIVYLKHTTPLGGILVTLTNELTNTTVAETKSANDGEFLFYDIPDGSYTLNCASTGYAEETPIEVKVANGQIVNVQLNMIEDEQKNVGTVSGLITDKNGKAVTNAVVGLYEIILNEEGKVVAENLISLSRTNSSGKYLFGNIEGGNYVVKAKSNANTTTVQNPNSSTSSTTTDSTTSTTSTTTTA